jgi:hypothetical protein
MLTTKRKNKPQKATQGDKITHMGERRWRRSSKEIKKALTSKQKTNVNPMGSFVFYTQYKGICCYNNMKDNLVILKFIFPLSILYLIK